MKNLMPLLVIISLLLIGNTVSARSVREARDVRYAPASEEAVANGIYRVRNRPDLRVRVFVYKEKTRDENFARFPRRRPPRDNPPPEDPTPTCGLTDPQSNSVIGSAGWYLPSSIDYRLNIDSVPSSVGGGNLPAIVNNSFGPWQSALDSGTTTSPSINRVSNTTKNRSSFDGQNIIAWGKASRTVLGVTYIWYYTATGEVAEVDTIMNKRMSWMWSNSNTCAFPNVYDAQNIMVHELGHWFGLSDEYNSSFVNNTMYGYGSKGEVKKNTLTNGDIIGAQLIY